MTEPATPRDYHRQVPESLRPLTRWLGRGARRTQHALRNTGARPNETPIFVLGNQKSGTSAIAALLGRACGLSVSIDMRMEVDRPSFHRIPSGEVTFRDYVRRNRWEFSHDIVKEPNLTFLYPQLQEAFPGGRTLFIVRDPRDNLRSLLNAVGIPGDLADLDPRLVEPLNAGWKLVLDSTWMDVAPGHYVEHLARRWNRAAEVYLADREHLNLCRYEDFARDKVGELARLAEIIERPVVAEVSGEVDRQYQTLGDRAVARDTFFGSENLARIEDVCAAGMRALGYA